MTLFTSMYVTEGSDLVWGYVLFQFYLWDQFHVTIVWNTRETGDMYGLNYKRLDFLSYLILLFFNPENFCFGFIILVFVCLFV